MRRGFLYLVAIMDWHTRKILAWRISNTLEADFCVEALNEAIHKFGPPEIMNTDQGSQFTSFTWTDRLIPTVIDQNPCAHLRMPREMIFHGWSMRLFQAWQHSATMSS